ncbi:MAG: DegT/DnrJ/EryC1/StrS family aminotransferase [Candidatus Rokubacteria bacterium]|nr:DegT/DnrJ/EryC1/StrS family aminotransferase [Candidatus Rokubacteria bacterium]
MIPQIDLTRQHAALRAELLQALERVLASSRFILGPEGKALEVEVAALCGVRHGVGVASGTDALHLALRALDVGLGAEVITPAFSFVASASAIVHAGARPIFADIDLETFALDPARVERAITSRTKAIVAVHLYGHPADVDALASIARRHGLAVIEDAAQAIGASYAGRPVGSFGDLTCLSFYPTKNLGACGDAGMVVTDREELALRVRRLRDHGSREKYQHSELGWCSRLDELQAAVLRVKLRHLPAWTSARRRLAAQYSAMLADLPLTLPIERPPAQHVYHHYTVRSPKRDALAKALAELGVGTTLHYPLPLPSQPLFGSTGGPPEVDCPRAWRASREVLSLPCFPELTEEEVEAVGRAVHQAVDRIG